MQVSVLEAKTQLSQLIRAAMAGEEVIIANRSRPVARLVAIDPGAGASSTWASAAPAKDLVQWLRENPAPDYARRSADEIQSAIQAERNAWEE